MYYANSSEYFEISMGPQLDNTLQARFLCVKDFLRRCAIFPLALIGKACKTFFRLVGICFGVLFVLITLGSSFGARQMFVDRIICFARDLADWVLLPLAFILCFLRLLLALIIHPTFYSNAV